MTEQWIVSKPGGPSGPFCLTAAGLDCAAEAEAEQLRRRLDDEIEAHKSEWSRAQHLATECERSRQENARLSTSVKAYKASYHALTAEADQLRKERNDLAAKLETLNIELHELRIKTGLR
jgi:chromosome segregation ATPase